MNWDEIGENRNYVLFKIYTKFEDLEGIKVVKREIENKIAKYSKNYVWQVEEFSVKIKTKNNINYLYNKIEIGDSIEDEWFIVFLLKKISKNKKIQQKFTLLITIKDNDGEFLLIEGADHLPRWISKTKNSKNRVFLNEGKLHLIPININIDDPSKLMQISNQLSKTQAKEIIFSKNYETEAPKKLQKIIFDKIKIYKNKLPLFREGKVDSLQEQHFFTVKINEIVATIILNFPNFISAVVNHLFEENPKIISPVLNLKKRKLKQFYYFKKLENIQTNKRKFVKIRFSRYLFAKLNFKQFPGENQWLKNGNSSESLEKRKILGKKLEIGADLFFHYLQIPSSRASSGLSENIFEKFHFLLDLDENQYFQWKKLVEEHLLDNEAALPPDSSEDWLFVSPEEIDNVLVNKKNQIDQFLKQQPGSGNEEHFLNDLMNNFSSFMNQSSGIDGIDLPDPGSSSDSDFYDSGASDSDVDDERLPSDPKIVDFMKEMDSEIHSFSNGSPLVDDIHSDSDIHLNLLNQLINIHEELPGHSNPLSNLLSYFSPQRK